MRLVPKVPSSIPKPRGPLMSAVDVARECFDGKVSPKWVKEHVPHKVRLGHSTVLWYRDDVLAFIESQREESAA